MKRLMTTLLLVCGFLLFWPPGTRNCFAQNFIGKTAPLFRLKDFQGKTHDLSRMQDRHLIILYFFDAASPSSQQGLLGLDRFAKKHQDADLTVWAITRSPKDAAAAFARQEKLLFPVLLDDSRVCEAYGARVVLPTVCILGPKRKVLDHIRGGGKSSELLMVRLAERQLQRNRTLLAKELSNEAIRQNSKNIAAKAIYGYAELKEGRLDAAEKTFQRLTHSQGTSEILGMEGLSSVYLEKGMGKKAMTLAREVESKAPERGRANVIKGRLLLAENQGKAAQAEFTKAAGKKVTSAADKSMAYNQLGRIQSRLGNHEESRSLYDKAVEIDPYLIEAASNKGVSYERQGRWDLALTSYRQAISMEGDDGIAAVLAKNAEKKLALEKDLAEKERIGNLVKELAQRFRAHQDRQAPQTATDKWISRPMALSFLQFSEKGGMAQRDGLPIVVLAQLSDLLKSSGRVQVVERALIEQLLMELNLSSSELANPQTALKLGKLLSAKLIGTGSFYHGLTGTVLSMRIIDTETSEIMKVVTRQLKPRAPIIKEIHALNRDILKDIISTYPLKGYVVRISDDRLMIDLGADHGVVSGSVFEVLEKQAPIEYRGKTIQPDPKSIARCEVVKVERELSYARILHQRQTPARDNLVKEVIAP